MDYQAHYDRLIARARRYDLLIVGYTERHHVLPRCLGGGNEAANIVRLTPEEHYVAHQLLVKIHRGHRGITHAAWMMSSNLKGKLKNNRTFGWLRRRHATFVSKTFLGVSKSKESIALMKKSKQANPSVGEKNWMYGRGHTPEACAKISVAMAGKKRSKRSAETRAKQSASLKGKPKSVEAKKNMQIAQLGRERSVEERARVSAQMKLLHTGKKFSLEHKAKISQALSGSRNPMFGKHHTAEHCAKISAIAAAKRLVKEQQACQ